jgi:hypothetical protein
MWLNLYSWLIILANVPLPTSWYKTRYYSWCSEENQKFLAIVAFHRSEREPWAMQSNKHRKRYLYLFVFISNFNRYNLRVKSSRPHLSYNYGSGVDMHHSSISKPEAMSVIMKACLLISVIPKVCVHFVPPSLCGGFPSTFTREFVV